MDEHLADQQIYKGDMKGYERVRERRARRALMELKHGGHVIAKGAPGAREAAANQENIILAQTDVVEDATPFDYLFPDLPTQPDKLLPADDPAVVVLALKLLGDAMVEDPPLPTEPLQSSENSIIPPVFTYWGQFVDHDLTANTDRSSVVGDVTDPHLRPLPPDTVTRDLKNLRTPTLNLDSVYADGPTFVPGEKTAAAGFYDGSRFMTSTCCFCLPATVSSASPNLLRGYLLSIPTGQALAERLQVKPLTEAELTRGNSTAFNDILREAGFLKRTPLWYYVLKEAEVRANGNSLGELGSRIVCETILALLSPEVTRFPKGSSCQVTVEKFAAVYKLRGFFLANSDHIVGTVVAISNDLNFQPDGTSGPFALYPVKS